MEKRNFMLQNQIILQCKTFPLFQFQLLIYIVLFNQIDLEQIKQCFLEITGQTLWKWIHDDTSGDYRKLLCGIVDIAQTEKAFNK